MLIFCTGGSKAIPHNSRLTAQAPLRRLRHGICVAKMLDNVGLRYPHRASGAKAPRTLRPLPLLRFAVSATGGAHLCSIQYYLRFWLSICRTSLVVSALRIMRYCPDFALKVYLKTKRTTDISQTQAEFKAKSHRNPLRIPRLFNAKSRCVCRNRLNFRIFSDTPQDFPLLILQLPAVPRRLRLRPECGRTYPGQHPPGRGWSGPHRHGAAHPAGKRCRPCAGTPGTS